MNPIHTRTHTDISVGIKRLQFQLISKTKTYLTQSELFSVIQLLSTAEPQWFPLLSEMNRNAIDLYKRVQGLIVFRYFLILNKHKRQICQRKNQFRPKKKYGINAWTITATKQKLALLGCGLCVCDWCWAYSESVWLNVCHQSKWWFAYWLSLSVQTSRNHFDIFCVISIEWVFFSLLNP